MLGTRDIAVHCGGMAHTWWCCHYHIHVHICRGGTGVPVYTVFKGSLVAPAQVVHQLVFCLDLLMDDVFGFIRPTPTPKGTQDIAPSSMCPLLAHLYFLEPFNFPLIALLERGLFDDLLRDDLVAPSASGLDTENARERRNAKLLHVSVCPCAGGVCVCVCMSGRADAASLPLCTYGGGHRSWCHHGTAMVYQCVALCFGDGSWDCSFSDALEDIEDEAFRKGFFYLRFSLYNVPFSIVRHICSMWHCVGRVSCNCCL